MSRQDQKKVLITGGSGFIGQRSIRDLAPRYEIVATFHDAALGALNIESVPWEAERGSGVDLVERTSPEAIVHLLALTSAERCSEDPGKATRINVEFTRELAEAALQRRIPFVFTSTDQVFDGRGGNYAEDHPVSASPGVYARTKIETERILEGIFEGNEPLLTIFRIALSYGWSSDDHVGPVGWIIRDVEQGKSVNLFHDEFRSPVFVGDIARAVGEAIDHEVSGLFHLAGPDQIDRHSMGLALADKFGLDPELIQRRSVEDYAGCEPRLRDVSMRTDHFAATFGWAPCGLEEGLNRMAKEQEDNRNE